MDLNNMSYMKKLTLPVYKPCVSEKKTSAEIIKEARETMTRPNYSGERKVISDSITASVRPVNTQRPFTPKDSQRILFGRNSKTRPPSSFSLRYLQFENSENVATKSQYADLPDKIGTTRRNSTSDIFKVATSDIPVAKIKLPSIESCFRPFNKIALRSTISLDQLPEEHEHVSETPKHVRRNAYSSPNESTSSRNAIESNKRSSDHLVLEPRNLDNIFPNKQIIHDSDNLFTKRKLEMSMISEKAPFTLHNRVNEANYRTTSYFQNDFNETTLVLEHLNNSHALTATQPNDLLPHLQKLYDTLKSDKLINNGGKKLTSKLKLNILKTLYRFVESHDERVLLNIARIILAIKVTGSNLTGVCKLVFKISRDDKNDGLFMEDNTIDLFLEALGSASPIEDTEALIYGYGAIKFLTMNPTLLNVILNQGILELMVLHIKIINNAKLEKVQIPDQANHVLFQLTGALRNLASDEATYEDFVTSGAIGELCQAMELFVADVDVVSNISRILSITSTHGSCCENIMEFDNIFVVFSSLLEKYPGKQDLIVRLGYIIGNLVAKFDYARYKFYNARNSMASLLHAIDIYIEKDSKCSSQQLESNQRESNEQAREVGGSSGSIEDVIIKMIRIIANIAMNSDVGIELVNKNDDKLIDIFLTLLSRKLISEHEELVLSLLSTFNNLSYYYTPDTKDNAFEDKQLELSTAFCKVLQSQHKECIIESIRVLGNLTRSKITRQYIIRSGTLQKLILFLDDDDMELLKTTIGVFINLMADEETRAKFRRENGPEKIIKLLLKHGENDWALNTLICQVLWNYSIDCTELNRLFNESDLNQLLSMLVDYLDEERIFGISEDTTVDITEILASEEYVAWEEFANVGTNLLEKIEYFLDGSGSVDTIVEYTNKNNDTNSNDIYLPISLKNAG